MNNHVSAIAGESPIERLQQFAEQRELAAENLGANTGLQDLNEIENAAKEFESVFLSLMLKEMRNTLDQENGGLFAGEGSDTFGGMFDMYMSQHLAKSQPLGIGNAVGRALEGYTQMNNS